MLGRHLGLVVMLAVGVLFFAGCGQQIDVVDPGTYEGTITEVNADEEEIYVALDNDTTIELYFKEDTVLKQGDAEVPFSTLQKDQKVRVTVERVGNRLDPKTVEILD